MSTQLPHWFADIDESETTSHKWQPCLETFTGILPSIEIWFANEASCEKWIAENLATPTDVAHAVALERATIADLAEAKAWYVDLFEMREAGDALHALAQAIRDGAHNQPAKGDE